MRTHIFIFFLVFIASSPLHKVCAAADLYLDDEGSGDDDAHPSPSHRSSPGEGEEAPVTEGSGASSTATTTDFLDSGGGPGHEDDEDNYYLYDSLEEEERTGDPDRPSDHFDEHSEGSGWFALEHPTHHDHMEGVGHREDDFSLPHPREEDSHPGFSEGQESPIAAPVPPPAPPTIPTERPRMPSTTTTTTTTQTLIDDMDETFRIVSNKDEERQISIFAQPGYLAAFIGGAVVGLLLAILVVMFIVYRMRKRDEGSYPLDEPKRVPLTSSYSPNDKEIYA